jgi:hypothetical protein
MPDDPTRQLIRGEGVSQVRNPSGFDQIHVNDPRWSVRGLTYTGPTPSTGPGSDPTLSLLRENAATPSQRQAYTELESRSQTGPFPFTVNLHESPGGPQPLPATRTQRHENIHAIDQLIGRQRFDTSTPTNLSPAYREFARGPAIALHTSGRNPDITETIAYGGVEPPDKLSKIFGQHTPAIPGITAGFLHTADKNFANAQLMQNLKSQFHPVQRRAINQAGEHFKQVDRNLENLDTARSQDIWERLSRIGRD